MSFKAAFKKKEYLLDVGTEAWRNYINLQAPEGTYYEFDGESNYFLKSKENSPFQMKAKIKIPEDLKKVEINDANELSQLLYRAQRTVEIEEPDFSHEGTPIKTDQLQKKFNQKIEEKSGKFYLSPKPFNDPFKIPIMINGNNYYFKVKQVPFPSLKEVRFESSEDGIFFIKLSYNEETNLMDFSLTYNLKKANSITEIFKQKKLLQDLTKRNVKIINTKAKVLTEDQSNDLQNLIDFYYKLYKIEEALNIQFNPKEKITVEDVLNTNKTYSSFVEKTYYYNEFKHDIFEITLKEDMDFSSLNDIAMLGYNEVTVTILDQSIKMVEQFVLKCTEPIDSKKKLNKKGETIKFKVKDDKIRYNKLFSKIPDNPDMSKISKELENATNISKEDKI